MNTFVLDAYNLIHAIPSLNAEMARSLRHARDALIRSCLAMGNRRGDVSRVILVFDGDSAFRDLPSENYPGLRTVYTESGEDADEWIIRYLHAARDRSRITVVSNDNYVTNHARGSGAGVMDAARFQNMLVSRPGKRRGRSRGPDAAEVPAAVLKDVTESYRRHLGID